MTSREKQQIAAMRSTGNSYKGIAEKLGLSVNTVKTFCRRNNLTGVRPDAFSAEDLPSETSTHRLLSETDDGNTTDAEAPKEVTRTGASAGRQNFRVTLEFAEEDDETAVADVIQMLLRGR